MPGKEQFLPLSELTAISTLDGRNRQDVAEIAPFTSEYNIIRTRVEVEGRYLIALSEIGVIRPLFARERRRLATLGPKLFLTDARRIKKIEDETQHDVTAMTRGFRTKLEGSSLEDIIEMVHYGLTSADVDNLTYRLILKRMTDQVFIPTLDRLTDAILTRAEEEKETMLGRTHGQPAVPTTVDKELVVFADRLNKEVRSLAKRPLTGKLTGAIGNLNALQLAHPDIDWLDFSERFVRSFGFEPNLVTTQINSYEDMIEYFQNYKRINGVLADFNQDLWRYISDSWFVQEARGDEVGSSAMPQKINPWRLENSEGNLEKADAILDLYGRKLSKSRLQRDNSDSTLIRDMGVPLGWSLIAYKYALDQFSRARTNREQISHALNEDWTILSEAAQIIMRKYGVKDPHTIMRKLTQGRHLNEVGWHELVDQLPLPEEPKKLLHGITPENYIGLVAEITQRAIDRIKASRNN